MKILDQVTLRLGVSQLEPEPTIEPEIEPEPEVEPEPEIEPEPEVEPEIEPEPEPEPDKKWPVVPLIIGAVGAAAVLLARHKK